VSTDLVTADDGLPAEVVGAWVTEKHAYLRRYVDITAATRRKYREPSFIDPFSSCGRALIRDTGAFVDGSPVVAWTESNEGSAPFKSLYIADIDRERRRACAVRLERINAPVVEVDGDALAAAAEIVSWLPRDQLHLAFLDPHNLGALNFQIIEKLASLERIDMLIHVSVMDLQRNLAAQLTDADAAQFDAFAPGWRSHVDASGDATKIRAQFLTYWKRLIEDLGMHPFTNERLIRGDHGQRLYWLMLVSRHTLAHEFWEKIGRADRQGVLF
jgi:three-Cys-motif partner protein